MKLFRWLIFFFCGKIHINLSSYPFLSVQFRSIKYIHMCHHSLFILQNSKPVKQLPIPLSSNALATSILLCVFMNLTNLGTSHGLSFLKIKIKSFVPSIRKPRPCPTGLSLWHHLKD